ncbi:MAG: hypothetical protein U1E36_03045 [Rickettsiales bacterium]
MSDNKPISEACDEAEKMLREATERIRKNSHADPEVKAALENFAQLFTPEAQLEGKELPPTDGEYHAPVTARGLARAARQGCPRNTPR